MNFLTNLINVDISAVRALGGTYNPSSSSRDVIYIPFDMNEMLKIRKYYNDETIFGSVNIMKNSYSTIHHGVKLFFLDEEIDNTKYGVISKLTALAEAAREWHDMFGFVAIYNPAAKVKEFADADEDEDLDDYGFTSPTGVSAFDSTKPVFEELARILAELGVPNAETISRELGVTVVSTEDRVRLTDDQRTTAFNAPSSRVLTGIEAEEEENDGKKRKRATDSSQRKRGRSSGSDRTIDETITQLLQLQIMPLESGKFYLEVDRLSNTRRIVFEKQASGSSGEKTEVQNANVSVGKGGLQSVRVDPTVYVHVWKNRMPEEDCRFKTGIYQIMELHDELQNAKDVVKRATIARSRRLLLVETEVPKYISQDGMTQAQLFGAAESGVPVGELEKARAEWHAEMEAIARTDKANGRILSDLQKKIVSGQYGKLGKVPEGAKAMIHTDTSDLLILPSLLHVTSTDTMPDVIDNTAEMEFRYHQMLALKTCIPMHIIQGGNHFSGKTSTSNQNTTAAVTVDSDKRVKFMVISDREILVEFVNNLWDMMYRKTDNEILGKTLSIAMTKTRREVENNSNLIKVLKQQIQDATDVAFKERSKVDIENKVATIVSLNARLRAISEKIQSAIASQFRFTISFTSLSYIYSQELELMRENNALSELEYANAFRVANNMKELSQQEFEAMRKEKEERELEKEEKSMAMAAKYSAKPENKKPV